MKDLLLTNYCMASAIIFFDEAMTFLCNDFHIIDLSLAKTLQLNLSSIFQFFSDIFVSIISVLFIFLKEFKSI